jgi:hypothetical protein
MDATSTLEADVDKYLPKATTKMHCSYPADCPDVSKNYCAPRPVRQQEVPIYEPTGGYTGKMGKLIDFECQCVSPDDAW